MKPEIEERIFGYSDPEPPPEGSWKAEVFKLIEQAEGGSDEFLEKCIQSVSDSVARMRAKQAQFFKNHFGR